MRRRGAAPAESTSVDPAPVDAEVAAQSALIEHVAAAVVETVMAAAADEAPKPEPTRRRARRAPQSVDVPAPVASAADAPAVHDLRSLEADALAVTIVDERGPRDTAAGDVAVIMQSTAGETATTPVALPTSPITLPPTRRVRRRAIAADETPAADALAAAAAEATAAAREPQAASAVAPQPTTESTTTARPAARVEDEFEAAARLFAFTGETPVQAPVQASAPVAESLPVEKMPRTRSSARRIAATSFSVGVMGVVGLLTVGMTMPVSALASANGTANVASVAPAQAATTNLAVGGTDVGGGSDIQAYVAPAGAQAATVDRADGYTAATYAQVAADSGIKYPSNFYTNDTSAAIQWPFAVGVSISYGFGMRDGQMHEGADFVPGEGSPVQAIADGVVRLATEAGGGYGVEVVIDHKIDGQLVSSRYAHMLYGSLKVKQGDQVKVGQVIGNTGDTGHSFGAHTHFEILQNGTTAIDPIVWLRAHAGRHSLD